MPQSADKRTPSSIIYAPMQTIYFMTYTLSEDADQSASYHASPKIRTILFHYLMRSL